MENNLYEMDIGCFFQYVMIIDLRYILKFIKQEKNYKENKITQKCNCFVIAKKRGDIYNLYVKLG